MNRIAPILSMSVKSRCIQDVAVRLFSTTIILGKAPGFSVVSLNKPPVNSLNTEHFNDLIAQLDEAEKKDDIVGVIIKSNIDNIFSAGLDINEMYNSTDEKIREFWNRHQEFWMKLYGSKLFTIAQINGQSPAGGCATALACDYRIMDSRYRIGLNEVHLGIVAPSMYLDMLVSTVGQMNAELILGFGEMHTAEEALKLGLVHKVCSHQDMEQEVEAITKKIAKIPAQARYLAKIALRQPILDKLLNNRQADIDFFAKFIQQPKIQKSLELYLKSLKKSK